MRIQHEQSTITRLRTPRIPVTRMFALWLTIFASAACLATFGAAPAAAQGGTTVETAPLLTPGQTVSGNTAADSVIANIPSVSSCIHDAELWTLNLTAGEKAVLNGQVEEPASGFQVLAVPPGVTDAELAGTSELAGVQRAGLGGLSFAAGKTGTWLIIVARSCDGSDGPYQLAATVTPPAFPAGPGGGTTIETAPFLTPGQTVSGNTAADSVIANIPSVSSCIHDAELWTLNLTAGEKVVLNGQVEEPASGFQVLAVPPGVTDVALAGVAEIPGVQSAGLGGLSFAAGKTGTWLIIVARSCDGSDGPYQLAATVTPPAFPAGPGGGTTIETAPFLTPGQTVSGNTAADSVIANIPSVSSCIHDAELWRLNVTAGDKIVLKGQVEEPADGFQVLAIPPGVTDVALAGVAEIPGVQSAGLGGLSFAAGKTGTWLIIVARSCDGSDGPYQLTATGPRPASPPRPTITGAGLLAHSFTAAAGTKLHLTLSEAGSVVIALSQILPGRLAHGKCSSHARHGRRCSVSVHRATLTLVGAKGSNELTLRAPSLKAGRYTATITVRSAGGRVSNAVVLGFAIRTPPHRRRRR